MVKEVFHRSFIRGGHMIIKHDVVAICGAAGSGKDTFVERWNESPFFPVENVKFARLINEISHSLLGDQIKYEDRDVPLKIDVDLLSTILADYTPQAAEMLGGVLSSSIHMSWRGFAQWLGTAVIRSKDPDFFVRDVEAQLSRIKREGGVAFLTDARFENEFGLASLGILLKRDTDTRVEFDPYTHKSERAGEYIAVWSNRYLACRDNGLEEYAAYCLDKLHHSDLYDFEVHGVYQTLLDAEGVLQYTPIEEAYALFELIREEIRDDWFLGGI